MKADEPLTCRVSLENRFMDIDTAPPPMVLANRLYVVFRCVMNPALKCDVHFQITEHRFQITSLDLSDRESLYA